MSTKIRVKVIGKGTAEDPFRVNLPTYCMVEGTEEYEDMEQTKLISVEVLVPADECTSAGSLDKKKIRKKYRGNPSWDNVNILSDV